MEKDKRKLVLIKFQKKKSRNQEVRYLYSK